MNNNHCFGAIKLRQFAACLLLLPIGTVALPAAESSPARRFEVQVSINMTIEIAGKKHTTPAKNRLRYTVTQKKDEIELGIEEIESYSKVNGKVLDDVLLNQNRFRMVTIARTLDYTQANATEAIKGTMRDLFDSPVCVLKLDKNGLELERRIVAGPKARQFASEDTINLIRLFHAPFYENKEKWEADVAFGGGGKARVSGKMLYEKDAKKSSPRFVSIKIRGELIPSEKNAVRFKFSVVGEQIYDLDLKEWVSGNWKMANTGEGEANGMKIDSISGETTASMRHIPDSETRRRFELLAIADVEGTQADLKGAASGKVRVGYTYNNRDDESYLVVDEIDATYKVNDKLSELVINRDRFRAKQSEKAIDFAYEKAPEKIGKQIEDTCRLPVYKFRFDKNGNELSRTNIAGPEAQAMIQDDLIANFRMFHAPYYSDRNKWVAEVAINSGATKGSTLSAGMLTFAKSEMQKKERLARVSVDGTLTTRKANTISIKNLFTKHVVSGEQFYDLERRQWVRGEWSVSAKQYGEVDDKLIECGSGKLTFTMKSIDDK